ncbi:hypothetical protein F441_19489 [Phytophthora nicotianae CJ01A1]|uniref:Uncharacterized protein n=2 Tax=Phytophthora nicotianae TaxID=4792 RepID=W2W1S2_PHYNI|nr:hypothetical protein L916_21737 [Phytophthora nicotianae]ETP03559.1 hypothetical protein F441_19489 [Phytophthora nicotianae CJ01A1]
MATYTSRHRRGDPDPPAPLPMTHQTVRGTRSAVLPSASFPPWVRPFRRQGAKKCFEQVLSTVLPDPLQQVDRQLLPEDPFFFSMKGFDPLASIYKRAPLETRIRCLWTSFRGDGPMPNLGFALWERRLWILAAAVGKGFTVEEAESNCDKDLIKAKRARFRVLMGGRSAWGRPPPEHVPVAVLEMEFGHQVENLPFVPKTTDWLAEVTALVDRQPWRSNWVYRPFDHPYNTTYVPRNREARIFCPRGVDVAMANQIARAITANSCLQSPELIPD